MTTEEDFHVLLDANPDDHQTRAVFADWLEERGDERAEGYRAMSLRKKRPTKSHSCFLWHRIKSPKGYSNNRHDTWDLTGSIPLDWLRLVEKEKMTGGSYLGDGPHYMAYGSRREAENTAALAFAKLPAERRTQLLTQPVTA